MKPSFLIIFLSFSLTSLSQPQLSYLPFAEGFIMPVDMAHAGDARLFVAERSGIVKTINGNTVSSVPFLDIRNKTSVDGDRGLLSIAFHPDYKNNGYFFVYYTEKTSALPSSGAITIERYKISADPQKIDSTSGTAIISINKPVGIDGTTFKDHNGGDLNFGPEGLLYFGTGDGGKEVGMAAPGDPYNNAQNRQSLLGKLLRIDVDKPDAKPEMIALGLRNPWRWSFDKATSDIWIGDVGHYKWEEIDFIRNKGRHTAKPKYNEMNFGWRCYEAYEAYNTTMCANTKTDFPVHKYVNFRSSGGPPASATGGFVYRGIEYPSLYGYYVSADMYSGEIHFVRDNANGGYTNFQQKSSTTGIVSFAEDRNGELYAISIFTGKIFKIKGEETPLLFGLPSFFIKIYPTLVTSQSFTLRSAEKINKIDVTDINGNLVFTKWFGYNSGQFNVALPNMASGTYFVKVYTSFSIKTERIIIQ
jgi:glucose/arabinose dehydrogenase